MSLEDLFKDEPATPEVKAEPTPEPEPQPEPEPAKEEEKPAIAAEPAKEEEPWTKKAYLAEKAKRQELERRLQEKVEEERPYLGEEYEARFTEVETRSQLAIENSKIALSEEFAKEKYTDFDEKREVFMALAAEHPELIREMRSAANPAGFAYKVAVQHKKMEEMQNPDEYEKKVRERIRAEVKAEQEAEAAKRDELPGSLAGARGVAGTITPAFSGPTPLSDILK